MADTVDEPGWRDRIQAGRPRGVPNATRIHTLFWRHKDP